MASWILILKHKRVNFDFKRTFIYPMSMRLKDESKSESIFNAAIQLINEHGFAETPMSKIAKKANVSASTIYVYFENKEDMLNKLYLNVKKKMGVKVFNTFDETAPLQKSFETTLRKFFDFILANKDEFLFMEQFSNSPLIHKVSRIEGVESFLPIHNLFEQGIEQNVFKQVDKKLLVIFAFDPIMKFAKEYFNGQIELNEENLNWIIQMSWDSMKA